MVYTRVRRFSRHVLRLSTFDLSLHAKQKKHSIIVKNSEKQLDLRPVFKSKPNGVGEGVAFSRELHFLMETSNSSNYQIDYHHVKGANHLHPLDLYDTQRKAERD